MTQTSKRQPRIAGSKRSSKSLLAAMIVCLAIIFLSIWGINSLLADVTGEYSSYDSTTGEIILSLVHTESNIQGELSYGSGPIMEMQVPQMGAEDKLDCTFTVPQRWIDEGKDQRQVNFHGTVNDGVAKGILQEGSQVNSIVLQRNLGSSLYMLMQTARATIVRSIRSVLPFG